MVIDCLVDCNCWQWLSDVSLYASNITAGPVAAVTAGSVAVTTAGPLAVLSVVSIAVRQKVKGEV